MNAQKHIDILVIDDNPDMLRWFEMLNVPTSFFHFHTLQNELNVANVLEKMKPSLIFLDVTLNTLDGPFVASIIGGHDHGNIPIIYISADKKYSHILDSDQFLLKPLTKEIIFQKVKEVLS